MGRAVRGRADHLCFANLTGGPERKERGEMKRIAKALTDKMQNIMVIDWRKKQQAKARVRSLIEEALDELPEAYGDDVWSKVCSEVFMHVFDKLQDRVKAPTIFI